MRKKTLERTLAKAFAEFAAEFPVAKGSLTATYAIDAGCTNGTGSVTVARLSKKSTL